MPRELSETFRMFWKDFEIEDLATYKVLLAESPKTFGMFRKVSVAYVAGNEA